MNNVLICLSLSLLLILSPFVPAAENMTLHGTLVKAPDCHINDGQTVEVSFGSVGVNKVDGVNYVRKINYIITCDGESDGNLYLSVSGTGVAWNGAAVKASADNLAIEIRREGEPFMLDTPVKIDLTAPPSLSAVPVSDGKVPLTAGEFTATATLIAFYQ